MAPVESWQTRTSVQAWALRSFPHSPLGLNLRSSYAWTSSCARASSMCRLLMKRFWHNKMPNSDEYPPAIVSGHGAQVIGRGRCGVGEGVEVEEEDEEGSVGGGGGNKATCWSMKRTIGPVKGSFQ